MAKAVALVDIDGTLIKGNSAEKTFFWFLFKRGYMRKGNFLRFAIRMLWLILTAGLDQAKGRNKSYLKGVRKEDLQQWIQEYAEELLPELISPGLRFRIANLKKQGVEIILLSGSLQPLVEQIVREVNADFGVGVELESRDGRFTGKIKGTYPFGENKLRALAERIALDDIDWASSWAFADRLADLSVLKRVGHPVAVNPEKKLEEIAREKGWEIIKE